MQLAHLAVGFDLEPSRMVVIFGWISIGMVDSGDGLRIALLPSTMPFTLSFS